jgi:UDP-N-acetylmuramyl pentapeptide phosphotransferase/UDP-N-acetylglucosamine-1-phosphate transferase
MAAPSVVRAHERTGTALGPEVAVVLTLVFVATAIATRRLVLAGSRRWLLDHPNERSLHQRSTTRGGGLAIAFGVVVGAIGISILISAPENLIWLGAGASIIVAVSFLDDLSHVHPGVRISVHFLVALGLVVAGYEIDAVVLPGMQWPLSRWTTVVLTCLYVLWLVNLYNFMDGMDGFAGGMALSGFATFALLGVLAGQPVFAALSGVIAAAAGGFLLFNYPPARIFMGDTGSSLLGFLAAGLSLWAAMDDIFPLWIAVLIFSPFIVDATVTLGRRLWSRERVWEAHKSHCYQRLVQLGWGHRKTVVREYFLMILSSISAVVAMYLGPVAQWCLIAFWLSVYLALILLVDRLEAA